MDITTLAAAKKYTDDKLISSGNSGAVVDNTLTISGAAADAKAVGDKFTSLELKMLTDDDIPEIAQQAAKLIDTALLSILGDGVIE